MKIKMYVHTVCKHTVIADESGAGTACLGAPSVNLYVKKVLLTFLYQFWTFHRSFFFKYGKRILKTLIFDEWKSNENPQNCRKNGRTFSLVSMVTEYAKAAINTWAYGSDSITGTKQLKSEL